MLHFLRINFFTIRMLFLFDKVITINADISNVDVPTELNNKLINSTEIITIGIISISDKSRSFFIILIFLFIIFC